MVRKNLNKHVSFNNFIVENNQLHVLSLANYHYLWIIILAYTVLSIYANWFCGRLIYLKPIVLDAGIILFPITLILSSVITEVYGFKKTRLAIWIGSVFNILYLIYGYLISKLPIPNYFSSAKLFDQIILISNRIVLSSLITYYISETLNGLILAQLKIKFHNQFVGLRFLITAFFSTLIDSFIFIFLSFYKLIPNLDLIKLIIVKWIIKLLIEIVLLPITLIITQKLKKIEQVKFCDKKTNFNLFSLDTKY